jgi:hypothetical protein
MLECSRYLHLLIRVELRLLHVLFLDNTILRVAELEESSVKFSLGDVCHLFDLRVGQLVVLVE